MAPDASDLHDERTAKVDFERQAHHFPAANQDAAVRKQVAAASVEENWDIVRVIPTAEEQIPCCIRNAPKTR